MKNQKFLAARKRKLWTHEKISELTGLSTVTVSRWENGLQAPHSSTLTILCDAFEMAPYELGFEEHTAIEMPLDEQGDRNKKQGLLPEGATSLIMAPFAPTDDLFSIGIVALILAQQTQRWSLEELHIKVDQEMGKYNMQGNDITRRGALRFLAGLPLAFAGTSTISNHMHPGETLGLFTAGIPACWKLYYNGGDLHDLQRTTTTYINHLKPIIQVPKQQTVVAALLSQTQQLASMIALENEDYNAALSQANSAIDYAQIAQDPNVETAAIMRKVTVLWYRKRYQQMSSVLQLALQHIDKVSPLMQATVYSALAADAASKDSKQDIIRTLNKAIEICPQNAEQDPVFSYTYTTPYLMHFNEEITHTNLNMHKEAWEALERAERYVPNTPTTRRIELLSHQVTVATAIGDLDLSYEKMKEAITTSRVLNSELWFSDMENMYEIMQHKWKNNVKVKELGEMIRDK